MGTFGDKLRGERENRGIPLDEIAAATKISERYLQALEKGQFEQLPSEVFAKGFIRAYAQHIGADAGYLLDEYERERADRAGATDGDSDQELIREMSRILTVPGQDPATARRRTIAWSVAGLIIVVAAVWLSVRRGPEEPETLAARPALVASAQPEPDPVKTEAPPPAEPEESPPPPPEPEPRRATVTKPKPEPPPVRRTAPPPVTPEPEPAPVIETRPEPEPEPPAETSAPTLLTIPDYGVGSDVVDRRLVGINHRFTEGQQVWFWNKVIGARTDRTIRHVWIHHGREVSTIELRVEGAHWRTYSRQTLQAGSAGAWAVEARDETGRVLARRDFDCVASP